VREFLCLVYFLDSSETLSLSLINHNSGVNQMLSFIQTRSLGLVLKSMPTTLISSQQLLVLVRVYFEIFYSCSDNYDLTNITLFN
jgi:hypothetical protein